MTATMSKPATQKSTVRPALAPPDPGPPAERDAISEPFRLAKSETLRLPLAQAIEAAKEHQQLPSSPTERDLDPKRVKELVDRIKTRTFLPCCWATVAYDGTKYRMNGHHSSTAMTEAADALPATVCIHLDHYEVEDRDGMGILFRQFDARWSSRSRQDVAGAYQGLVPELGEVDRGKAKLGIEGAAWYERSIEGLAVPSSDDLYGLFLGGKYTNFLRWLNRILTLKTPELKRAPIVGAMYGTFITSESGAQEFWPHVAKSDLPDDNDPRNVLSAELVRAKEEKGNQPSPAEFYAKCIKAWNAFRGGDTIRSLNVNTKKGLPEIAA